MRAVAQEDIPKLYYSIGQVSRIAQVDPHVLRYWETEFKQLAPRKNRSGKRLFREADLKVILRIKELLYHERYTIEGARRRLAEEMAAQGNGSGPSIADMFLRHHRLLADLQKDLVELKKLVSSG
jgi:DNA-binding transcriptional MerR regulator